jgi:hypothetical protein
MGDQELVMGLDRATLAPEGDGLELKGVVDSPAPWEYEIKMQAEDWSAILHAATRPQTGDFIARKVGFRLMLAMALAVVKFVLMLSYYSVVRGRGRAHRPVADPVALRNAGSTEA